MSSRNTESVVGLVVIVVALSIFWLSKELNLDFTTTATCLGYSALVIITSWFIKQFAFTESHLLPIVCSFLALSWFPALDYWALQELPSSAFRYSDFSKVLPIPWYTTWYFKTAIFFAPLIYGYVIHPRLFSKY